MITGRQSVLSSMVIDYYRRIDDGDVCAALSCFADNAVYRRPGYPVLAGIGSIESYYVNTRVIGAGRHDIEVVVASPDEVAVRGCFEGTARDGSPLSVRFADFWRFTDDRVVERNTYFDAKAV
jgi:ketosteroid isomerase-like protein